MERFAILSRTDSAGPLAFSTVSVSPSWTVLLLFGRLGGPRVDCVEVSFLEAALTIGRGPSPGSDTAAGPPEAPPPMVFSTLLSPALTLPMDTDGEVATGVDAWLGLVGRVVVAWAGFGVRVFVFGVSSFEFCSAIGESLLIGVEGDLAGSVGGAVVARGVAA